MADQKLTERDFLTDSTDDSLIHIVENKVSHKQLKSDFLKEDRLRLTANEVSITSLEAGQTGGLKSFTTLALLQAYATPDVNDSYKVTNDPTSSNNGYYHWSGSAYVKDANLVNGVVESGNVDAVSGESVYTELLYYKLNNLFPNPFWLNDDSYIFNPSPTGFDGYTAITKNPDNVVVQDNSFNIDYRLDGVNYNTQENYDGTINFNFELTVQNADNIRIQIHNNHSGGQVYADTGYVSYNSGETKKVSLYADFNEASTKLSVHIFSQTGLNNTLTFGKMFVSTGTINHNFVDCNNDYINLSRETSIDSAISAEATERANADTILQGNIDAESIARGNADTTLQSNIDAEEITRTLADNSLIDADLVLQSQITTNANSLNTKLSQVLNSNIVDEEITLIKLSTALKNYIDSSGGGTITNNADDITLSVNGSSQLKLKVQDSFYVSNNGLDMNSGLSPTKPFLTIGKALTVASDGDFIYLECGSIFYENVLIENSNITIQSYGVGEKPYVSGETAIVTPTLVSGNVYTTTNNYGVNVTDGRIVMFEDGIAMFPVSNTAECEALKSSYVAISGDSMASGNYAVQFHKTSGKVYTTNTGDGLISDALSDGIKLKKIKVGYTFLTPLALTAGENNYLDNCDVVWGTKHNLHISANSTAKNIIAYGSELQGQYSRTSTFFVAYSNENALPYREANFDSCACINDLTKPTQQKGNGMIGFFCHTSSISDTFDKFNVINCYGRGIGVAIGGDATECNIINCFFEEMSEKLIVHTGDGMGGRNFNIKNSFFGGIFGQTDLTTITSNSYIDESIFIYLKISSVTFLGDLTLNNSVFIGDSANFMAADSLPPSLIVNNCIIFNYTFGLIANTVYEGDYNIFRYISDSLQVRNKYNGTQYTTLSSWQTATGQDTNSVYLTTSQSKTFFLTDPKTGDMVINPSAEVTSSNGTVYTGTFPDGTKLTDKITNKIFSHRKNKYVDNTQY